MYRTPYYNQYYSPRSFVKYPVKKRVRRVTWRLVALWAVIALFCVGLLCGWLLKSHVDTMPATFAYQQ